MPRKLGNSRPADTTKTERAVPKLFEVGGAVGAQICHLDWCKTSLGPIDNWPQSLITTLRTTLSSAFPMYLLWGSDLNFFHNDTYIPILGRKCDPLGKPFQLVWPELWEALGPAIKRAFIGEAVYFEDMPLVLKRNEFPEQTWFTFSYSPVRDANNIVQGVLCVLHETTDRLHLERHLRFLVEFGNVARILKDPAEIMTRASEMLAQHLGAVAAGYGELEENREFLTVQYAWTDCVTKSIAGRYCLADLGPDLLRRFETGSIVHFAGVGADSESGDQELTTSGLKAGILVPIIRDTVAIAAVWVQRTNVPDWRSDELNLVREVAERTWEAVLRVRAEAALHASEKRFRQFAEHSSHVLWIADMEAGRLEYLSPAFERVWGGPPDPLLRERTPWITCIHPDDRESTVSAFPRVMAGEVIETEYRILRPDGSVRWMQDTFFPIPDGDGLARRVGGIAVDRTVESSPLLYVVDADDTSRQLTSLLLRNEGYQVKEFAAGRSFLELTPALQAGCVVLNVSSCELEALTVLRELKARRTNLPVIAMGQSCSDISVAVRAMKAGAVDWLETPCRPDALLSSIASASAELREVQEQDRAAELAKARISAMTSREREVLNGLLCGGTNKTIGRALGLSPRTVEIHRAHVMERLGARTLPELVSVAIAAGLRVSPPDLSQI